jgi:hypothetical protein
LFSLRNGLHDLYDQHTEHQQVPDGQQQHKGALREIEYIGPDIHFHSLEIPPYQGGDHQAAYGGCKDEINSIKDPVGFFGEKADEEVHPDMTGPEGTPGQTQTRNAYHQQLDQLYRAQYGRIKEIAEEYIGRGEHHHGYQSNQG